MNADNAADLARALQPINLARSRGQVPEEPEIEDRFGRPATRLAVYGSLAPGEVNHWVIEDLGGTWSHGHVRGTVRMKGWGSHVGFPGMTWIPDADERIPVRVFASEDLPAHWERLDAFEGEDYVRILVPVETADGPPVVANIYQLRDDPSAGV